MRSFSVPPLTIEIAEGDIAAEQVDAIVNAANNAFWMGSGVAGALKLHGGVDIEREAMALGPVEPGECVVTSAGRLSARIVIHASVMGQDLRTSSEVIARATTNALKMADQEHLASLAFPAFGTGVGGFSLEACAHIMLGAVHEFAPSAESLRLVRLVLFGRRAYDVFVATAEAEMH